MFGTSSRLLAGLAATSAVVSLALVWSGWRLLAQQRDLDRRLAIDRAEAAANAMAAGIREKLADVGDRLSVSLTASPPPSRGAPVPAGLVLVVQRAAGIDVEPEGALPFVPGAPEPLAASPLLADGEAAELRNKSLERAFALYARLTHHPDPLIRAGALMRVGRVLRKSGRSAEAVAAYERLATMGDVRVDTIGVPASLLGLDGQRLVHRQLRDTINERRLSDEILRRLDAGEWRLSRGIAEFYRDEVSDASRPDNWRIRRAQ